MWSSKCLISEMVRILIEKHTILISWVARIFWKVQLQGNPFYVDLFYFSNKVNHWLIDCWVLALQKINDHHNKKKQKFVHDSTFFLYIIMKCTNFTWLQMIPLTCTILSFIVKTWDTMHVLSNWGIIWGCIRIYIPFPHHHKACL